MGLLLSNHGGYRDKCGWLVIEKNIVLLYKCDSKMIYICRGKRYTRTNYNRWYSTRGKMSIRKSLM